MSPWLSWLVCCCLDSTVPTPSSHPQLSVRGKSMHLDVTPPRALHHRQHVVTLSHDILCRGSFNSS